MTSSEICGHRWPVSLTSGTGSACRPPACRWRREPAGVLPLAEMGQRRRPLHPDAPGVTMRGAAAGDPASRHSIWPAVHPLLLDLTRAHRSTLVFVNSRRLAERLAARLNELAGE